MLLPYEATFTGSRGENLDKFGGHDSSYHRQESGSSPWVSLSPIHHELTSLLGNPLVIKVKVSPVAQMVKNLPAMQQTWVLSLGQEDPLEKGKAPHSSILAWRIPWKEESGRLQSTGSQRVRND